MPKVFKIDKVSTMKTHQLKSIMLGLLMLGGAAVAQASNISGTYADKGSALSGTDSAVSLHALFALEFRPEVGLADHGRTASVNISDADGWFEFKTYSESGTEISRSRWGPQNGFSHEEDSAVVRISETKDVFYTFMMQSAADGAALEVKVHKVTPSTFGPGAEHVGTYFFVKTD